MSTMFGRLGVDQLWCDLLNKEAFLWHSFKHLGSQILIYLIDQGETSIRSVEKSDKAKIKVFNFVSSILTSCITMLTMFGRLGDIDRDVIRWIRKLFFGALPNI